MELLTAVLLVCCLAVACGCLLGFAANRFPAKPFSRIDAIDRLLPQTQCERCGHPGCRPYASAIASGNAEINQCPPGGERTIRALAELLGRDPLPLNPDNGREGPRTLAVIDEASCIGCTLCIKACPVDAILGSNKLMHTVIAAECTGCDLCLPPCPVDCISMVPAPTAGFAWAQAVDDERALS